MRLREHKRLASLYSRACSMTTDKLEWKQRAESFLESHLGDDNYNAEEAAVYFLSRGINTQAVSDTINKAVNRWKNDNTRWSYECRRNPTRASSTLRLMQWGKIGALQQYRDSIFQNFGVPYSQDFYPNIQGSGGYNSRTSAYFPLLFPLFTSDIAVKEMDSKLISLLHQWQNHLNDLFLRKELFGHSLDEEKSPSQIYATLISAYIFGAKRLGQVGIESEILNKSIQYLLDHQQDSGLWAYDQTLPDSEEDDCVGDFVNSRNHTILASMGIHALSLTNAFGAESSTEKAASWLLQHQHSDGGWYQHDNPKYEDSIHTTVMAMDSIELANGGKQVTFRIDGSIGETNGISPLTVDNIRNPQVVYVVQQPGNIIGSSANKDLAGSIGDQKPSKRQRRSTRKSEHKIKYHEWTKRGDAKLIFTKDERIKFYYNEIEKDLFVKHGTRHFNLLALLFKLKCVGTDEIKYDDTICKKKTTPPSEVVRQTNKYLNKRIHEKGFIVPDNVKYIGYDNANKIYRFYIEIDTSR
jgi:hypothetical protein